MGWLASSVQFPSELFLELGLLHPPVTVLGSWADFALGLGHTRRLSARLASPYCSAVGELLGLSTDGELTCQHWAFRMGPGEGLAGKGHRESEAHKGPELPVPSLLPPLPPSF